MRQGRFITFPGLEGKAYLHPWKNPDRKFNSRSEELLPGDGLLTLKRDFRPDASKKLVSAKIRATALGIFDMFLNGERVALRDGDYTDADELKPGWTDYRFRVFEFEYDVTGSVAPDSDNLFVAEVSPGWWNGRISFGFYGWQPNAFCAEIELEYEGGTVQLIPTGTDWDAAVCGPVLRADIWDGEYYDARIPEPSIEPEAHKWTKAAVYEGYSGEIVPFEGARIRSCGELVQRPVSAVLYEGATGAGDGCYGKINKKSVRVSDGCEAAKLEKGQTLLLDFGQNMVGRPVLFLKAPRGRKITVYFAEMLNDSGDPNRGNDGPEGSAYIKNYRSALARLVYVAAGTGETELYFPTHTFFGFRYLEITADGDAEIISVRGDVIRSDVEETGDFFCDNPEVNRLFSNIVWGMRGNYLSVPTDCPQRDERLGWTGDTQIFCGAASYLADIGGFMHKWLRDARDSQKGFDGAYADVIPRVFGHKGGNAAWAEAGLIVPYRLWQTYGDREIIEEHYDSMESYMDYLSQFGLEGPNTAYGDWLNYEVTDKRYIAVCYYFNDAKLMEKFSQILGKADRAAYYSELASRILAHWREKYFDGENLSIATQTGYLLPLSFGMVEGKERDDFIAKLKDRIVSNDYTLSTGFVGTGILCRTLSECGLDQLAYSLLLQTRDPSWLYSVRQGATTVWERWNSYTLERGFGDVGMNSFNHYAFGAVAEWMFSGICGIRPDPENPGFETFIIRPTPDMRTDAEMPAGQTRINTAHATYAPRCAAAGECIESGWERVNGAIEYSVTVPSGTSARGEFPAGKRLKVNGLELSAEDLGGGTADGRYLIPLAPGSYAISVEY